MDISVKNLFGRGVILEILSTLMTEPSMRKDLQTLGWSNQDLAKVYLPLALSQTLSVLLSNPLIPCDALNFSVDSWLVYFSIYLVCS